MSEHTPERDIDLKIENVVGGIRRYGYRITARPLPGREQDYYENMRACLHKIERDADWVRREFRCRSMSRRTLETLHRWLPEPCWGVSAP